MCSLACSTDHFGLGPPEGSPPASATA